MTFKQTSGGSRKRPGQIGRGYGGVWRTMLGNGARPARGQLDSVPPNPGQRAKMAIVTAVQPADASMLTTKLQRCFRFAHKGQRSVFMNSFTIFQQITFRICGLVYERKSESLFLSERTIAHVMVVPASRCPWLLVVTVMAAVPTTVSIRPSHSWDTLSGMSFFHSCNESGEPAARAKHEDENGLLK